MASVLTVVGCFDRIMPKPLQWQRLDFECIADMLSMCTLSPNTEQNQCHDFYVVLSLLPISFRKTLGDALQGFCTHLAYNRDLRKPQWLYAIPLVHFLLEKTTPFGRLEIDPEQIVWNDKLFGLGHVKSETSHKDLRYMHIIT